MDVSNIVNAVDTHTAGEPTRIVLSGCPPLKGETIIEKREYLKQNYDYFRTALIYEPRGHKDMFGAILLPPVSEEADFGVIFMDHGGYLDMCGHGIIGVATAVFQLGMIEITSDDKEILFDTPAGLIKTIVRKKMDGGNKSISVSLYNVPSFVYKTDVEVEIQDKRKISLDIAFGGNFFALVSIKELNNPGVTDLLSNKNLPYLSELGMLIKEKVNQKVTIQHPALNNPKTVELVEFFEENSSAKPIVSKNIVIFGDGQFDRSPCGTGSSAAMARLYFKGKLSKGEQFINYGILGSHFEGEIAKEVNIGDFRGIIPKITGQAFVTGMHQFLIDTNDPFKYGFSF